MDGTENTGAKVYTGENNTPKTEMVFNQNSSTNLVQNLYDRESEVHVLAAMMDDDDACLEAYTRLVREDFYIPLHSVIFSLISDLFEREVRPSFIELLKEGQLLGLFTRENDRSALQYISEQIIDSSNIDYWIENVRNKSMLRKLSRFLRIMNEKVNDPSEQENAENLLYFAEEELTNLTAFDAGDVVDSPEDVSRLCYDEIERRYLRFQEIAKQNKGIIPLDGLPTGFDSLNHLTLGFKPGDLIILGAQTGHGKTAFALHLANEIAVKHKTPILYLNTEMSREQIALRWGSILTGIEHERIRSGEITQAELSRCFNACAKLSESGFYAFPCPNLTPEKTTSITRKYRVQKKIEMLIIDYVGRMDKIDPKLQEWQMLEQIVKTQKILAQNLNIVVMCLVQLNPDGTLQGAKRMKNECDLMLKLAPIPKEELENNDEFQKYETVPNYSLYIEKNRDGQSGVRIPILFDLQRQILQDAKRVSI